MTASREQPAAITMWGLRNGFKSIVTLFGTIFVVTLVFVTTAKNGERKNNTEMIGMNGENNGSATCDFFSGQWVYDNTSNYPLYLEKECKFMSDHWACEKFGREDFKYRNWRWQPHGCNIPRFNATKLLARLRHKRMVFVGDSLNRNQWNSMVCLLSTSVPDPEKTMKMQYNGSLLSFKAKEYNATIDFYWSPLLLESNSDDPDHHRIPDRIVRAHSIEKHARHWTDADILIFNTFLWWRRRNMKLLWGSFDDKDGIYKDIDSVRNYELALQTWSEWLEFNIDHSRTKLFFMTMSSTHLWADEWGKSSKQSCYNETEPITKEGHWGRQSSREMMQILGATIKSLKDKGVDVQILNITQLSEYRKDGHPSIHRKQWDPLTKEQQANPVSYADCIHWCLPGVPDVWNELLYAYICDK